MSGRDVEDVLQELVTEVWGRGAAISHDPHPDGGWVTRAWDRCGAMVDVTHGTTKALARDAMLRELRKATKTVRS